MSWTENGSVETARWRSEAGAPPPARVTVVDDTLRADDAYRLACEGTALLWRGDYHNAKQLLTALARRIDRTPRKPTATSLDAFNQYRQAQAQRARTLGRLIVPLGADYSIPLRRAPDLREACFEAWGPGDDAALVPLRELLGVVGAHEWRHKGVDIAALGERIHPHYGVFSPVRGEYLSLIAAAPLPAMKRAFDVGTGTGVIAAILARRGVEHVVATDRDPRALACARENLSRLGLARRVDVVEADLFPAGRADLVVCNPPWLPGRAATPLDHAIYDPDGRMLRGFLEGLSAHLEPGGEGWLVLSDLAEHVGLRTRVWLLDAIGAAGLRVVDRLDTRPTHPRATDPADPLHAARAAEVTSLWRLAAA